MSFRSTISGKDEIAGYAPVKGTAWVVAMTESREVFDLVIQNPGNPKEGILMTLGVPASEAVRGFKLLALLKQSMRISW